MKFRTLILLSLCASVPALACAKKPKKVAETAKPVAEKVVAVAEDVLPEITEDCLTKVSLFSSSVKNKQYADAFQPWWEVYNECPNANKAIYTQGGKIIEWKIETAADETEKNKWKQILIQSYDKRIKYFGNDPKYPTEYILGQKGVDYLQYFPEDKANIDAYNWLKTSVSSLQGGSQVTVLVSFAESSLALYKSNPNQYAAQYIADYSMASNYLNEIAHNPANKTADAAAKQKDYVDALFASSGAADCSKLDELYAQDVEENKSDLDKLGKIMLLFKRVGCTEADAYFAAAEYAHKLQPTEESAAGCAQMCKKKEDWSGAIEYYNQALNLITEANDEDKDDYLYNIALINMDKMKNYSEARNYARKSLEANPNQGRCYILIGLCYAAAKPYSEGEYGAKANILNKTVFWAAVDQFIRAKAVEPACADDANKLISSYSRYFPTKEERFDLPNEFSSGAFHVGGWVNETTAVR